MAVAGESTSTATSVTRIVRSHCAKYRSRAGDARIASTAPASKVRRRHNQLQPPVLQARQLSYGRAAILQRGRSVKGTNCRKHDGPCLRSAAPTQMSGFGRRSGSRERPEWALSGRTGTGPMRSIRFQAGGKTDPRSTCRQSSPQELRTLGFTLRD